MSTLKVTNIESPSGGGVNAKITDINGGQLSNRNLIINGAMAVAQRGTSETGVTTGGIYTADRWKLDTTDEATYTIEQSTDSPVGFKNSLKFTVTTADSTVAADDYAACHYLIEGNDTALLGFGASGAKSFTLSFYVKSSQTGTFGLSFQNSDNSKNFDSSYSISTADTWERKTITIPGDTSGTWLTTNGVGLKIWWSFLVGSTYEAPAVSTEWGTSVKLGLAGQVQLSSIANATWQITGVQLEVGEVATAFEHRSYGDELVKCKRYCQLFLADGSEDDYAPLAIGRWYSSTQFQIAIPLPVEMRALPSIDTNATTGSATFFCNTSGALGGNACTSLGINERARNCITLTGTTGDTGQSAGTATTVYSDGSDTAKLVIQAEL